MATQYIDVENQELLWNTFHKIPKVSTLDYEIRQTVFQESLERIYHQISPNVFQLSRDELQELNKRTIAIFFETIQSIIGQLTRPVPPASVPTNEYNSHTYVYETPAEKTNKEFEEKQKQYQSMTTKPDVPKPSELFQEPADPSYDGAIQNMDELIAQYQEQRDKDIPTHDGIISNSSVANKSSSSQNGNQEDVHEILLRIQSRLDTIEKRLTDIEKSSI
jgi:hypothetical protein